MISVMIIVSVLKLKEIKLLWFFKDQFVQYQNCERLKKSNFIKNYKFPTAVILSRPGMAAKNKKKKKEGESGLTLDSSPKLVMNENVVEDSYWFQSTGMDFTKEANLICLNVGGFDSTKMNHVCFFTGKFLLKPLPIYIAEAMDGQCCSSDIGEVSNFLTRFEIMSNFLCFENRIAMVIYWVGFGLRQNILIPFDLVNFL